MAIVVGGVAIDLQANAAQIVREMDKAGRSVSKAARDIEQSGSRFDRFFRRIDDGARRTQRRITTSFAAIGRVISRIALPVGLAGGAAGGLGALLSGRAVTTAIRDLDQLAKTADKVGVSVENLQRFRFAAEQSGVATRQADLGLQRFARRVGEAVRDTGELRQTLQDYNIQLRDSEGRTRSVRDILADYADAVASADSRQEQLRLAFKAFDSEGAALVNLLREGSAGLEAFEGQADRLGIVLEKDARAAEAASDALGRASFAVSQGLLLAVSDAIPQVERLADAFVDSIPKIKQFITGGLQFAIDALDELRVRWRTTLKEANIAIDALNAVGTPLGFDPIERFEITFTAEEKLARLERALKGLRNATGDFTAEIAAGEAERQRLIDQIQLGKERSLALKTQFEALDDTDLSGLTSAVDNVVSKVDDAGARIERLTEAVGNARQAPFFEGGRPVLPSPPKPRSPQEGLIDLPTISEITGITPALVDAEEASRRFGFAAENAFQQMLDPTRDFVDTLKSLPNIIGNLIIQMAILEPLAGKIGSALGGLFAGGGGGGGSAKGFAANLAFAGIQSFQSGGSLPRNRFFLAGEAGPELGFSGSGGHIFNARITDNLLSAAGGGGGGQVVNVQQDLRGAGVGAGAEAANAVRQMAPFLMQLQASEMGRRPGLRGKMLGRR